jgi:hypothetical protein
MPVEAGKVVHFNGLTNHMHTTAYVPRDECESHWTYGEITELPARAERATLDDLLRIARADLGPEAIIELDQELVTSLECSSCHSMEEVLRPVSEITFEAGHCPTCGELREAQFTHMITGEENFLHHTLAHVGIPQLHILRAHNGFEYRFYELTGDLPDALHFRHFERTVREKEQQIGGRIRLKEEVRLVDPPTNPARDRIRILDEKADEKVSIKPAKNRLQIKGKPDVVKLGKSSRSRVHEAETIRPKKAKKALLSFRHKHVKVC